MRPGPNEGQRRWSFLRNLSVAARRASEPTRVTPHLVTRRCGRLPPGTGGYAGRPGSAARRTAAGRSRPGPRGPVSGPRYASTGSRSSSPTSMWKQRWPNPGRPSQPRRCVATLTATSRSCQGVVLFRRGQRDPRIHGGVADAPWHALGRSSQKGVTTPTRHAQDTTQIGYNALVIRFVTEGTAKRHWCVGLGSPNRSSP